MGRSSSVRYSVWSQLAESYLEPSVPSNLGLSRILKVQIGFIVTTSFFHGQISLVSTFRKKKRYLDGILAPKTRIGVSPFVCNRREDVKRPGRGHGLPD